jgi:hypothetical protein
MDEKMLAMNVAATGNVLSDDYGPMMIVREMEKMTVNVKKEAEELMIRMEGSM